MATYPDLKLYIAGDWRRADGQPVINPADESVLATVPHASRTDLDDALAAAEQGFKEWSRTSPAKWTYTEIIRTDAARAGLHRCKICRQFFIAHHATRLCSDACIEANHQAWYDAHGRQRSMPSPLNAAQRRAALASMHSRYAGSHLSLSGCSHASARTAAGRSITRRWGLEPPRSAAGCSRRTLRQQRGKVVLDPAKSFFNALLGLIQPTLQPVEVCRRRRLDLADALAEHTQLIEQLLVPDHVAKLGVD
jgi:hypothetical protein